MPYGKCSLWLPARADDPRGDGLQLPRALAISAGGDGSCGPRASEGNLLESTGGRRRWTLAIGLFLVAVKGAKRTGVLKGGFVK